MPAVAIIMRAFNEMPHVCAVLDRLGRQTWRDFELFATDSGSTDGTLDALEGHAARLVRITPGDYAPGKVLNDAIAGTTQELVVLLNADAVPQSDDWLETLLRPLVEGRADAVYARQVARPGARFIVAYDYERAYDPASHPPDFFSAVACAFRRDLWERQRFREQGYAEDAEWARACRAGGARILFVPEAVVEHSHDYALPQLYRKRLRQAATFGERPRALRQLLRCLREIARDALHACRCLKLHTIPYNIAYRATIHAAVYQGLKEGAR